MVSLAKQQSAFQYAVSQLRRACALAGSADLIDDAVIALASANVCEAIETHDNGVLFDWLVEAISFKESLTASPQITWSGTETCASCLSPMGCA